MSQKQPEISFEFFPPKNRSMAIALWKAINKLAPLKPNFVSVTYGAGGSTRERTHNTIRNIIKKTELTPASHLTCVGASKEEISKIAKNYWKMGVKHIVALRGDLPQNYQHNDNGYQYANQLVSGLKNIADFEISVAGYPEMHPEARNLIEDIDNLKRKVDAGADRIITQFFFDNNKFYEYLNIIEKKQIKIPVIPGILPIVHFKQMVKFAKLCGTSVPKEYFSLFDDRFTDETSKQLLAAHIAIKQCEDLIKNNVKDFHFYTLNRAELTYVIFHILKNIRSSA
ncbi:MAG: methylenetetrahydrofolate reductase [NAD(P)H] [Alphaproteobacteria bacterium]|jgi:methylenetetrahydrofolate reductase (NADPH)|nr:methylenetetrahydrofolate reductase [NAD(P)H] [Alphaproteobacteria bacterium]MBT5827986.1 methylenetetrahydrofolate reductase [NAD(P)H] [Alphaproteobacteria bacterium]